MYVRTEVATLSQYEWFASCTLGLKLHHRQNMISLIYVRTEVATPPHIVHSCATHSRNVRLLRRESKSADDITV
jgi:hypothetical protein